MRFASHELSDRGLLKLASTMDPAMRSLALRHDPGQRRADLWARPEGWGTLDLDNVPSLGFEDLATGLPQVVRYGIDADTAQRFGLPCGGLIELVLGPDDTVVDET